MDNLQLIYSADKLYADGQPHKAADQIVELLDELNSEHPQQLRELISELDPTKLHVGVAVVILSLMLLSPFTHAKDVVSKFKNDCLLHFTDHKPFRRFL